MRSLKRSAIIFTISVIGLLTIRASENRELTFSGPRYSLESLAWQSLQGTDGESAHEQILQGNQTQSMMREYILPKVSKCTGMEPTHLQR